MKRNELVQKLITEGFSEKTLANMNDKQLNLLSGKILSEQVKKGSVIVKKGTNPYEIKKMTDAGTNVKIDASNEISEGARNLANTKGTKLKAGRFKKDEKKGGFKKFTKDDNPHTKKKVDECGEKPVEVGEGKKNWIKDAVKNKGGLHKSLGIPKDEKIPASKIATAEKKSGKVGKQARLAATLKNLNEKKEIGKWVDNLIENDYHCTTSKNEIMDLIKTKLLESRNRHMYSDGPEVAEPDVAEPTTKPDTKPNTPEKAPNEPYINPWERPTKTPGRNPVPDPRPKFKHSKIELPDFLKFDNILNSVNSDNPVSLEEPINETESDRIFKLVISKLKN